MRELYSLHLPNIPDKPKREPERPAFDRAYAFAPGSWEGPGDPTCGGCEHLGIKHGRGTSTYTCSRSALRPPKPINWRSRACVLWQQRKSV